MKKFQKSAQAFQHVSFRYLFLRRLFTVLGNGIAPIALAFAVLDIDGSASDLGRVVPQVVPATHLRQANAFIQLGIYGGTVMRASLGGMIIGAVVPGWGLAIDALGFTVSAPLYFLIRVKSNKAAASQGTILRDIKEGWAEFAGQS